METNITQRLRRIRHVALDMDGTIYLGTTLFPYTKQFLAMLSDMGIEYSFLTNNPTRSRADYLKKLSGMGIEASSEQMYTSALATIDYLKAHMPNVKKLYVVGTPSLENEMRQAGFELTDADSKELPDALVVAFDTTLTFAKLCRAAYLAQQGVPYIATNPDRVCPTDQPTVLVDCGSVCAAIEHATGRQPDIVIGKPAPAMLQCIMERHGLAPDEVAMCGDRIYTDVASAEAAGALGVLVLSGETTMDIVDAAPRRPDIVTDNVLSFAQMLRDAK